MGVVQEKALVAWLATRRVTNRFVHDMRGLTVSAVILIGILVVAVALFGGIAADKIGEAGDEVQEVDFNS